MAAPVVSTEPECCTEVGKPFSYMRNKYRNVSADFWRGDSGEDAFVFLPFSQRLNTGDWAH